MRLVRASWLIERAARARAEMSAAKNRAEEAREIGREYALPRRQELEAAEPGAYLRLGEFEGLHKNFSAENDQLRLVVVSHRWAGRDHPDPEATALLAVAGALVRAQTRHAVTLFTRQTRPTLPEEAAVMWDWVSLPQKDAGGRRAWREEAAYNEALATMQARATGPPCPRALSAR